MIRKTLQVAETALSRYPSADEGFADLLGLSAQSTIKLVAAIDEGFSYSVFDHFQRETGFPATTLAELIQVPVRTLHRRRAERRFSPEESDRLLRAARVTFLARRLFEGNMAEARQWLADPQPALKGATPLAFARTDIGAREVEALIGRLEHGVPS
ncbi:MAG: DUF2384 domain-containing protein [Gemmatimonadetes bacterium]|nr:DUF2384 domain-containing protein [Gemmatimonadota bacterium]